MKSTKTLKVRVRDKHANLLSKMARQVNFVWNFVNDLSQRSIKERRVFLSEYDLHPYALFTPRLPTEGKMLYTNSVGRWLSAAA